VEAAFRRVGRQISTFRSWAQHRSGGLANRDGGCGRGDFEEFAVAAYGVVQGVGEQVAELLLVDLGGGQAGAERSRSESVEALAAQGKKGRVLIPGRFLTGNQVSDVPTLVRAKLKGTLAPLQKEQRRP
jgi:hypothetical protein